MGKYIYFEVSSGEFTESREFIPLDYDFLFLIFKKLLPICDKFRIDCWESDIQGIEEAKKYGCEINTEFKNMRIFTGKISQELKKYLFEEPYDDEGKFIWFSLFLFNGDKHIFSCEHYGKEFVSGILMDSELEFIQNVIPKDFTRYIYEIK